MMAVLSPVMLLVFAVTVPIAVIFTRFKTRRIQPLFRKRSGKLGALNGYAEEMLSGHTAIKAASREAYVDGRFNERNEDAVTAYYNADYHGCIVGPSVNFINNLSCPYKHAGRLLVSVRRHNPGYAFLLCTLLTALCRAYKRNGGNTYGISIRRSSGGAHIPPA